MCLRKWVLLLLFSPLTLTLLVGCQLTGSPTSLPSSLSLPPATPSTQATQPSSTSLLFTTPVSTLRPSPSPTSAPSIPPDPYQLTDYVVLLNTGYEHRQVVYLTPAGNLKPVLPSDVADYCSALSPSGRLLCTDTKEPESLVALDMGTGKEYRHLLPQSGPQQRYLAMHESIVSLDGRWAFYVTSFLTRT